MNLSKNRKIVLRVLFILVIAVLIGITAPREANAAFSNWWATAADYVGGVATSPVTLPLMGILYVIKFALSFFITAVAFLVDAAIKFGNNILQVAAVQEGWKIVLQFTNLGFVLAIIVIAFATILRRETYAIKQTLGKLIVAALLVNFSLVICGAFISVSKVTTDIFYKQITDNEKKSMGDVLGSLAEPQAPQKTASSTESWFEKAKLSMQLQYIIALEFQVIMDVVIILAFLSLFAMFLIRGIALIFLIVLSPIVWLLWIFPATVQYWQKWWKEFIRWNFFATITMFFIYLAYLSKTSVDALTKGIDSSAKTALEGKTLLPEGIWGMFMNNLVLLSFLIAGLIVADKFGKEMGGALYGLAQKTGKKFGAWSGRMALRGGTGLLRKTGGPEGKPLAQRFQERTDKMGWIGRQTLGRLAGRAVQLSDIGVRGQTARYEKEFSKMSLGQVKSVAAITLDPLRRTLAELFLSKKGVINADRTITKEAKSRFAKYGRGEEYKDIEDAFGGDHEVYEAQKKTAVAKEKFEKTKGYGKIDAAADYMKAEQQSQEKQNEWISKKSKTQLSKGAYSKIFSPEPSFGMDKSMVGLHELRQEQLVKSFMLERPEGLGMVASNVPGKSMLGFISAMKQALRLSLEKFKLDPQAIPEIKGLKVIEGQEVATLKKIKEALKQSKDPAAPELLWKLGRIEKGLKSMGQSVFGVAEEKVRASKTGETEEE